MPTKSHAELEKFHYQAVRDNPMYVLDGMASVIREELAMQMPSLLIKEEEVQLTVPSEHKLYNELQQTKGLLLHLQRKLNELTAKRKRADRSNVNLKEIYK
uniref:Uncharacterized protein n=1 Tax=viral metagenome TaxID=1070528 RepID=A0A6M3KWQ3_9ZZZZ